VVVWPLAAARVGLALLAMRTSPNGPGAELPDWQLLRRLPPDAADAVAVLIGTRRGAMARVAAGVACVVVGLAAFVVSVDSWRALRGAFVASVAVVIGVALVIGPGVSRLVHALVSERRERIRADERADVAAHLHDSVLQTLALVQRRADEPREVVRLARMQERELRAWLLGGDAPAASASTSLGAALEEIAASIETEHGVPVEVVRVRDCGVDGTEPLLAAAREAILNAARHSGAANVSVYLEVEPDRATIFVRDRGKGFDPETVAADRGGISHSIIGRMARSGGRAAVHSTLGNGTEVELVLPLTKVGEPS
jgi:signal transduction histidine kinase